MKFKHWYYDLGFKTCVATALFTFTLTLSLTIPLLVPLGYLLFTTVYYLEKSLILFTYPLSFDSSLPLRRTLLIAPLQGLVVFQTLMFLVVSSVLPRRVSVYLFAGLALEGVVAWSIIEFQKRRPWDGREQKLDRVIEEEHDKVFESISSYHMGGGTSYPRSGSLTERHNLEESNHNLKLQVLRKAYEDPSERLYNNSGNNHNIRPEEEPIDGRFR